MNVLQFKDGRPVFELTGTEMTAPVNVTHKGQTWKIYPTLQMYKTSEMKSYLRHVEMTFEPEGDRQTVVNKPVDLAPAQHLCDRYFVSMLGLSSALRKDGKVIDVLPVTDVQKQKDFLDKNPEVKANIARFVYGNIRRPKNSNGVDPLLETALIIDDFESNYRYVTTLLSLCPGGNSEAEIDLELNHVFSAESEKHKRRWEKAGGDNRTSRISQGIIQTKHDYNEIEKLYDEMINELQGAVFDGEPCTETNKDLWVPHVPFFYKDFAVDELFQTSALKNA